MKKLLSLTLAAVMLLSLLAFPVLADDDDYGDIFEGETVLPGIAEETRPREPDNSCGENLTWSYGSGTLTITGTGAMDDFPDGAPWAEYKKKIKSLVLQGGVETVGAHAFQDYDNLENVDFGSSLREIGTSAFSGCDGLTSISLPGSFRVFGEESFKSCPHLTEFRFAGGMPSFRLNCLWDTFAKLIYPAGNPWPLQHIEQLESAFQGRIEFLASDGTDPFNPNADVTEETVKPATKPAAKPTEAPTEAPSTEPTTKPTTAPTEEPTMGTIRATEPQTEATTRQTELPLFQPTQVPQEPQKSGGISIVWVVMLAAVMLLSAVGVGILAFRMYRDRKEEEALYEDDVMDDPGDDFAQLGQRTDSFVRNTDWESRPAPQQPHRETLAEKEQRRSEKNNR